VGRGPLSSLVAQKTHLEWRTGEERTQDSEVSRDLPKETTKDANDKRSLHTPCLIAWFERRVIVIRLQIGPVKKGNIGREERERVTVQKGKEEKRETDTHRGREKEMISDTLSYAGSSKIGHINKSPLVQICPKTLCLSAQSPCLSNPAQFRRRTPP
jgi:hypothetical protein